MPPTTQGDLESVAALFGRITALRKRSSEPTTAEEESDEGAPLDAHVRVVMRVMKERLALLKETPLQARGLQQATVTSGNGRDTPCPAHI